MQTKQNPKPRFKIEFHRATVFYYPKNWTATKIADELNGFEGGLIICTYSGINISR